MEMIAAVAALKAIRGKGQTMEVRTGSTRLQDIAARLPSWKKRDWQRTGVVVVKNLELVRMLDEHLGRHQVMWVSAQAADPGATTWMRSATRPWTTSLRVVMETWNSGTGCAPPDSPTRGRDEVPSCHIGGSARVTASVLPRSAGHRDKDAGCS